MLDEDTMERMMTYDRARRTILCWLVVAVLTARPILDSTSGEVGGPRARGDVGVRPQL